MIPSFFTALAIGTITAITPLILAMTQWVAGSQILQGNTFYDTTSNSAPGVYVNDETVAAVTYPTTTLQETCRGSSGAVICDRLLKLTSSGGLAKYNAGSFVCTTASRSITRATLMTESGSDSIYLGWTNSPATLSGSQIFNYRTNVNGAQQVGTGGYLVPVNSTIKAVWAHVHTTPVVAGLLIQYIKYYQP